MEELSIEDKARRYDEAFNKAKSWYIDAQIDFKKSLENLFPELAELESEKIRKVLIRYFTLSDEHAYNEACGVSYRDIVAWLEKQGELVDEEKVLIGARKDVALSIINYLDNNSVGMCLSNMECEDIEDACVNSKWTKLYNYMKKKLEKQVEQKPTDKFKVGNWYLCVKDFYGKGVRFDKGHAYYCGLNGCLQEFDSGAHISIVEELYKYFRLWTIQDVKPGDMLAGSYGTFIFMGESDGYCGVLSDNTFIRSTGNNVWTQDLHPATKEQRDTLMKAMADAEYTFDFEEKELKKIIDEKQIKKNLQDNSFRRMFEQKPAWSEEDERSIRDSIFYLKSAKKYFEKDDDILWDEKWFNLCIEWLESLKDRVLLKQEWSEEDEEHIKRIIEHFEGRKKDLKTQWVAELHNKEIEWLKSLKPQNRWKPSDEQMEVLLSEVTAWTKGCPKQIVLESLYNDLKKLKG